MSQEWFNANAKKVVYYNLSTDNPKIKKISTWSVSGKEKAIWDFIEYTTKLLYFTKLLHLYLLLYFTLFFNLCADTVYILFMWLWWQ